MRWTGCLDDNAAAALASGELPAGAAASAEVHIDGCAECRALVFALVEARTAPPAAGSGTVASAGPAASLPAGLLRRGDRVGRYVIVDLLGAGAMGTVYEAEDPLLERHVALKLTRGTMDEALMLARVAHPNVVAIHDVGVHDEHVFLAMDRITGTTLRTWLGTRRSSAEIVRAFVEAGRGLAAAHRAGIVHHDFKPENVLVETGGRVLVTDFGMARPARDVARGGTPAYMAPEQRAGSEADARADQFGFCVALHEALFGSRPAADARGSPRLPRRIRNVLARGLAARPADRHASMDALLAELTHDPWRTARRYGVVAAAVVAVVCVVGVRHRNARASSRVCASRRGDGEWDASRRAAVERAFATTNRAYTEDALHRVVVALDTYAAALGTERRNACEASLVRRDESTSVLARRDACFAEREAELRSVVDVLARADEEVVRNAPFLVRTLPPLETCTSTASGGPAPPSPEITASVAAMRGDLARGRALREAGNLREALAVFERASTASEALGYLPLQAVALLDLGLLESRLGDKSRADGILARAARVADAGHDDGTRVRALGQRLYIQGNVFHQRERVAELDAEATSALGRLGGGDPRVEEAYRYNLGMALRGLGELDRAYASIEQAVRLAEHAYGASSYDAARGWSGLCMIEVARGEDARAIPLCERAAALFRASLGLAHPDVALAEQNLGVMKIGRGQVEEGCALVERAREVGEAALGSDNLQVVSAASTFGECLSGRGEHARAIATLERALASRERLEGEGLGVAQTLRRLGSAYLAAGDPGRAIPVLARALRIREAAGAPPWDRAASQWGLAQALAASGDVVRARALVTDAARYYRASSRGEDSSSLAEAEAWLAVHR